MKTEGIATTETAQRIVLASRPVKAIELQQG